MTNFGESTAGDLRPAPYNPRVMSGRSLELLGDAMRRFGDLGCIVYNVRTGRLVGGHQRLKAIPPDAPIERVRTVESHALGTVSVGWIVVDGEYWAYREVDWPENVEAMANIAANKHGGDFDFEAVRDILADLDTGELPLELSGFDEDELKILMAPVHGIVEDDDSGSGGGKGKVACPSCGEEFTPGDA